MGAVKIYVDTSVLVALFFPEVHSAQADELLRVNRPALVISDFTAAEFASGVSRRVRIRELTRTEGQAVLLDFDEWAPREMQQVETLSGDIAVATAFIRRLDLTLRTPDALNMAIAQRIGAELFTFDKKMAQAARVLGMQLVKVS
jgi:predicted nucleic acid-binding protein